MKTRTRLLVGVLALLAAAALAFTGAAQEKKAPEKAAAGGKAPKAVAPEKSIDVGDVLEVQNIEHTFVIRNEGDADLVISKVKPGCGCSVADFDKTIPPGGQGKVHALIYGTKILPGELDKEFYVVTNDPANETITLSIHGMVKKALDLSREMRWAGFADETFKLETVISDQIATPIDVTGARWDDAAKAAGIEKKLDLKFETIAKGKKYRLTIAPKGALPPEDISARVVLTTDNPKIKEKMVPVSITIMPDVTVYPPRIYYGDMRNPKGATKAFERTFTIVAARGDSLKVLKAVSNRNDMSVKILEGVAGKSYKGTVFVRPSSKSEQYNGTITITTNYPKYREIKLEVVGNVSAGGKAPGAKK